MRGGHSPGVAIAALSALAAAALLPQPAVAFNPQYIWHGRGVITALTSACSTTPLKVGQEFSSNYRPRVQPATEPPAGLTMVFGQGALVITQNDTHGHLDGAGKYIGFMVRSGANFSGKIDSTYTITVKNFFNGTAGFDQTTIPLVIDLGKINDFGATKGCTVTFRAAYVRNDP